MTAASRMRSYFAAPLFNEMERRYNAELVEEIEKYIDVFLPQRDGGLLVKFVSEGMPVPAAEQKVFKKDLVAIGSSDLLIAVLDGSHVDEGVAFEIGYTFALGKPCVGIQTDSRRVLPTGNNPMINGALSDICLSRLHFHDWLRHFVSRGPASVCRAPFAPSSNLILQG
jgi:nucleoside 2-deoxyribosyltransferase